MPIKGKRPLHFLLLGHAREHIHAVINYYNIRQAVLFTSKDLEEENFRFIMSLQDEGVRVLEVVYLEPFGQDALERMTRMILQAYHTHSRSGDPNVIVGITGGTNLMVVAMALVALIKGLPAHYVLNNGQNEIVEIDLFGRMASCLNSKEMEKVILSGGEK